LLFAQAREIAGRPSTTAVGETVQDVLSDLNNRFGQSFAEIVAVSRVWVNEEPATPGQVVSEGDEVAILPPVSGG